MEFIPGPGLRCADLAAEPFVCRHVLRPYSFEDREEDDLNL